jgi:hypothetical protein
MSQQLNTLIISYESLGKSARYENSFEETLTQSIDEVFSALGEEKKHGIYRMLKTRFDLAKSEIPRNIEPFADALKFIFGNAALLIEAKIIRTLHEKNKSLKFKPTKNELSLADYVAALKIYLQLPAEQLNNR